MRIFVIYARQDVQDAAVRWVRGCERRADGGPCCRRGKLGRANGGCRWDCRRLELGLDRFRRVHREVYIDAMTDSITVRDARTHLAELITSAESGTPTVITRNGTPAAVLVPIADYQALEDAADIILAREAAAALREEGEGRRYSLAEVIADVFAERTDAA